MSAKLERQLGPFWIGVGIDPEEPLCVAWGLHWCCGRELMMNLGPLYANVSFGRDEDDVSS